VNSISTTLWVKKENSRNFSWRVHCLFLMPSVGEYKITLNSGKTRWLKVSILGRGEAMDPWKHHLEALPFSWTSILSGREHLSRIKRQPAVLTHSTREEYYTHKVTDNRFFSHTHFRLWAAGTTQTCCWRSSLFRQTLGASWNWRRWCDCSTW